MSFFHRIAEFWRASYRSDRTAFYLEIISFFATVGASLTLAINASEPDMRYVYPGFFLGAATGCLAYRRRELFWPFLLTAYFCLINLFGYGRAMGWL